MRTKWDILQERLVALNKEAYDLQQEMDSKRRTPFGDGQQQCSTCGAVLPTEADVAKHYLVPDEEYLDASICPTAFEHSGYEDGDCHCVAHRKVRREEKTLARSSKPSFLMYGKTLDEVLELGKKAAEAPREIPLTFEEWNSLSNPYDSEEASDGL
jgi:hypothetical protein